MQDFPPRATAKIVGLAPREEPIVLARGDTLILSRDAAAGMPAARDPAGNVLSPARIGCTLPQIFGAVRPGEPIKLDDGKMEGFVRRAGEDEIEVEITRAKESGSKLKADKAINLPESDLRVAGLTRKDIADLDFIAANADMLGFSFVNDPADVRQLQAELAARDAHHIGIVLKVRGRTSQRSRPMRASFLVGTQGSRMLLFCLSHGRFFVVDVPNRHAMKRQSPSAKHIHWRVESR